LITKRRCECEKSSFEWTLKLRWTFFYFVMCACDERIIATNFHPFKSHSINLLSALTQCIPRSVGSWWKYFLACNSLAFQRCSENICLASIGRNIPHNFCSYLISTEYAIRTKKHTCMLTKRVLLVKMKFSSFLMCLMATQKSLNWNFPEIHNFRMMKDVIIIIHFGPEI
jgi:hypothetical protein